MFTEMLRNDPKLADAFGGFTVYTNTAGLFPFTGLSVAAVLTGERYDGTETLPAYHQRVAQKRISGRLHEAGYEVDLMPLGSRGPFIEDKNQGCRSIAALYDLSALRQLPTLLKEWYYNNGSSRIKSLCRSHPTTRQELDPLALDKIIANSRVSRDGRSYKYMHFYGMIPFGLLRKDCTTKPEPTHVADAVYDQALCVVGKVKYLQSSSVFRRVQAINDCRIGRSWHSIRAKISWV